MKRWHQAIIVLVSMLIAVFPIPKYAMSSDEHDNTSQYRVEYVTPESSKLKLRDEVLRQLNQEAFLVATVKVAKEGYVPSGIEVRTWVSPLIFTANISREILDRLESDPAVVSIEPAYKLRSH
jgi:uncharacterized membrane protein YhiD involved in acid resistance